MVLALTGSAYADNYGGNSRREQAEVTKIIQARFGHGWLGRTMLCIARRESGLNPRAANWRDANGGSHGLFQINGVHRGKLDWGRIYDPHYNTLAAWRLYKGAGLSPWGGGC